MTNLPTLASNHSRINLVKILVQLNFILFFVKKNFDKSDFLFLIKLIIDEKLINF